MTALAEHRRGLIYNHANSQARRAEERDPPTPSLITEAKVRHREELAKLAERQRGEAQHEETQLRQCAERREPMARSGARQSAQVGHEVAKQRQAFTEQQKRERENVLRRQAAELEQLAKKHKAL
jgi:hypothetical protein